MRNLEEVKQCSTTSTPMGSFQEVADTFKLGVELLNGSLRITLDDYVEWTRYAKQYTDDDIGRQINKKTDLNELFDCFVQTEKKADDETLMQNKQKGIFTSVNKYIFGTVIKNGEFSCYKVEKGGKITVFMNLMYAGRKKYIVYESNLQLEKVGNLTEIEILSQKNIREKQELAEEFNHELALLKKQRKMFMAKMDNLEEQNKKIASEFEDYKSKTELSKSMMKQELEKLRNEHQVLKDEIHKKMKDQSQKIESDIIKITKQHSIELFTSQIQKLKRQQNTTKFELVNMFQETYSQQNKIVGKLKQEVINDRNSLQVEKNQLKIQIGATVTMFDSYYIMEGLSQVYRGLYKVEGYRCTLREKGQTHFMFNKFLPDNESSTFKIRIIRAIHKCIMIGVVDYENRRTNKNSHNSFRAVSYNSGSKCKEPSGTKEGNGFSEGEVVEVTVNREANMVKWCVNGTQQAKETEVMMLSEKGRMFVPYVQMLHKNDSCEWVP